MIAPLDYQRGVAVSGVLLVIFLFAVDATVVSAAMPTIVGKLGGIELYSWVFSSYSMLRVRNVQSGRCRRSLCICGVLF